MTPFNTKCESRVMNNIDIMQQINCIHNTNPQQCAFRGAPFNPHHKMREHTMQYEAKNGRIPPQYNTDHKVCFPQHPPTVSTVQDHDDDSMHTLPLDSSPEDDYDVSIKATVNCIENNHTHMQEGTVFTPRIVA